MLPAQLLQDKHVHCNRVTHFLTRNRLYKHQKGSSNGIAKRDFLRRPTEGSGKALSGEASGPSTYVYRVDIVPKRQEFQNNLLAQGIA